MTTRRQFLLASGALAVCDGVMAQARRPRIGYLLLSSRQENPSRERQAFLDGLREFGYAPGKNLEIDYASVEGEAEFLPDACRDLLAKGVDMIVTAGAEAALAAKAATKTVPIVFLALGDPVGVGVVSELARPGGNVTGVSFLSSELAGKRMQILQEAVPGVREIAIVWDPGNRHTRVEAKAATAAARRLSMHPRQVPLKRRAAFDATFAPLIARKPQAIYVAFGQGSIVDHRTAIAEFGLREGIPVISGWGSLTEAGGLFSYAPNIPAMFHRGAYYVSRLLAGAKPGDLPVEQATLIELLVNARTARILGIAVPPSILIRADRVIE